jgi:hypothetical protein
LAEFLLELCVPVVLDIIVSPSWQLSCYNWPPALLKCHWVMHKKNNVTEHKKLCLQNHKRLKLIGMHAMNQEFDEHIFHMAYILVHV